MSWDAWSLVAIFIAICVAIILLCLVEDIRNAGRYGEEPKGTVRIRLDNGNWIDARWVGKSRGRHRVGLAGSRAADPV